MATRSFLLRSTIVLIPALAMVTAAACGGSDSAGGLTGDPGAGGSGSATTASGTNAGGSGSVSGTTTSSAGGGTGAGGAPECSDNGDCMNGEVCTPDGECVGCLPSDDNCAQGQFCDPVTNECVVGCTDDTDCDPGNDLVCNTQTNQCVGCTTDDNCPQGSICAGNICVAGCSPMHDCQPGFTCCGSTCYDLVSDIQHCGDCDTICDVPPAASAVCNAGQCLMGPCNPGFLDCNGDSMDGCEQNELQDGPCVCSPNDVQSCYFGAPGTENVGPCKAGTQTCNADGLSWGGCMGQVLPGPEICANNMDEDCDGVVDNGNDGDNDGWTICNGDCDDTSALVNPGAFEVYNNNVNDDCDANTPDNVQVTACSSQAKFGAVTANDVAQAMDICQTTTANPPPQQKKWGLINASLRLADGNLAAGQSLTDIQTWQAAVLQNYGTGGIVPKKFNTMAGISTGRMRDANDPGFVIPVGGSSFASAITFPGAGPLAFYLGQHGGNLLPGQCGVTQCPVGAGANDSVNIRLQIRVPTNAQSFSYDFRFFSGEYQSFQCTAFNDYYLAMLTTGAAGIPADHNISFDSQGKPVSVNNGFFEVCGGNGKNCGNCPSGTGPLAGTGMDQVSGGGTDWLTTDSPIVPGETMTLELIIFDVSDHIYDSLAILDNFRWSLSPAVVGTHE